MIRSMTGFGKGVADAQAPACHIEIELSSVNRKQLEQRWTLPRELSAIEPDLRRSLAAKLSRGAVSARVGCVFHGEAASATNINLSLLLKLAATATAVRNECKMSDPIDLAALMTIPGVVENTEYAADTEDIRNAALAALDAALGQLIAMRAREGAALEADLSGRMEKIESLLAKIKPLVAALPGQLKAKLLEKLAESGLNVDLNDDRLLKEVLFYADKSDTTEEITRLESHFVQFRHYLASSEPAGRSLDFLLQEMFREITTLSNKAGSPQVSPLAVAFKSELEKLREQVQNVE
ncbi:MAG: YicC/YloC family endoribonuclease [Victivallaceae bacterium]|nr:YicC/YloC family endoribonuclease [Victivallaceae bacterium]